MPQLDALIAAKPKWPYFYEIKGQFLFESGKLGGRRSALARGGAAEPRGAADPHHAGAGAARRQRAASWSTRRSPICARRWRARTPRHGATASLPRPMPGRPRRRKPAGAKQQYMAQAELASAEAYFYEGQLKRSQTAGQARQGRVRRRHAELDQGRRHPGFRSAEDETEFSPRRSQHDPQDWPRHRPGGCRRCRPCDRGHHSRHLARGAGRGRCAGEPRSTRSRSSTSSTTTSPRIPRSWWR